MATRTLEPGIPKDATSYDGEVVVRVKGKPDRVVEVERSPILTEPVRTYTIDLTRRIRATPNPTVFRPRYSPETRPIGE